MNPKRPRENMHWRKALLAARILLRGRAGRLTARDRRLAALLAREEGVTNRLIDQALWSLQAPPASSHVPSRPTVAP